MTIHSLPYLKAVRALIRRRFVDLWVNPTEISLDSIRELQKKLKETFQRIPGIHFDFWFGFCRKPNLRSKANSLLLSMQRQKLFC